MKNNFKVSVIFGILITMAAVLYQRATGPTYPKKAYIGKSINQEIQVKFLRSHGGETNAPIEIPKISKNMSGTFTYKRYPTKDEWHTIPLKDTGNLLSGELPNQPPAGKLKYFINLNIDGNKEQIASADEPIMIRFKGDVPTYILAPHIFFMFLSMLLSAICFMEAVFNTQSFVKIGRATAACLVIGGMILGPIVQKFAFGVYWAGFPFDWDLTDNKLLIGVLAWTFGVLMTLKKAKRWPIIFASIVLFGVYCIPHSMMGSEYNYEKGEVQTDVD